MDDDELSKNPLAPVGLVLSVLGGPLGLVVSFLALRRADRTGEGRAMAIAGLTVSAVWIAIAVFVLANRVNPGSPSAAADELAQPTGTTVTVNPAVADKTTEPAGLAGSAITSQQLTALAEHPGTLRGKTFVLSVHAAAEPTEGDDVIATVQGSAAVRVILRGSLVGDVEADDDFEATVTVTDATAAGLPVLQVSDLNLG